MNRRLPPDILSATMCFGRRVFTYHLCGYTELVELLLVVCARLGAVVGHKDELLAWYDSVCCRVSLRGELPLLLSNSSVSGTFS
jgi:hypothetical protein